MSQREKDKYCLLTHAYGIQKDGADEPICRAAMETQTQRTDLWPQWGKERAGQTERSMETDPGPHVKEAARGDSLSDTGSAPSALCQPRGVGWGGRWEQGSGGRGHMHTCS